MKLVSVIIPYYKKKKFIHASLKSVLNQTYQNFEIIIIYDDVNKSDLKYLRNIIKKNKQIKIFTNKTNIGAGPSRNQGIKLAKGYYIAFLDSDDLWNEKKIEHQLSFMKKNNISISSTSYQIINENNKIIGNRKTNYEIKYESILTSCDVGLSTVIIKKKLFNSHIRFPELKTKEDFVLWLKILKQKKYKFYGLNKNLSKWRSLNNSLSSNFIQKMLDGYKVYNVYMKFSKIKSIFYLLVLSLNFLRKI